MVRDAFRSRNHDAWSCDLEPSDFDSPFHLQDNVLLRLDEDWDLLIAHPPCTYLANSGVRWLFRGKGQQKDSERWDNMCDGAEFFRSMLKAPIPKIAVENPILHRYAIELIGRPADQVIHPWQFGHNETKSTCLWLKNLPKLVPTNIVPGREARVHKEPPSSYRQVLRSQTYLGIAEAMSMQWG